MSTIAPPIAAMRGPDRPLPVEPPAQDELLELALAAARDLAIPALSDQLQPGAIQADLDRIARECGLTFKRVMASESRDTRMVEVRRIMAAFLRGRGLSYPQVAGWLGYKDHTSVMHLLGRRSRRPARRAA